MFGAILSVLICFLSCSGALRCGPNQVYKKAPCDLTCTNVANPPDCNKHPSKNLKLQCHCKPGFLRNIDSECIPSHRCPKGPIICGYNEVYKPYLYNQRTCDNLQPRRRLGLIRRPNCYCKPGTVRETFSGICMEPKSCPGICREDEVYTSCKKCQKTCQNRFERNRVIDTEISPGCGCKNGLIRNTNDGSCVLEKNCPVVRCATNETYQLSSNNCGVCTNFRIGMVCPLVEKPGCYCLDGYVRNPSTKNCVLYQDCPQHCKDPNSEYSICPNLCPITCQHPINTKLCIKTCIPGCQCKEGFIKDELKNLCVPKSSCINKCSVLKNEELVQCVPTCPKTCQNRFLPPRPCPLYCKSGCTCKAGFIRNEFTNECIEAKDCPTCSKPNEAFNRCNVITGRTCQSSMNCEQACRGGCCCVLGRIRDEISGVCVFEDKCPKKIECKENMSFQDCKNAPKGVKCARGCYCNQGYVYDAEVDECLLIEKVSVVSVTCDDPNAIFSRCGSACPRSCANMFNPPVCITLCKTGCFCKKGFVLNSNRTCVSAHKCKFHEIECPKNQQLYEVLGAKFCLCKPGHLFNFKTRSCIPQQCRNCPENSKCNECGKGCVKTCENLIAPRVCGDSCSPRCECNDGYVFNDRSVCVPIKTCQPSKVKCPDHSTFSTCGAFCPKTCANLMIKIKCIDDCIMGCICHPGYVLNSEKKCVKEEECKSAEVKCPPNQHYNPAQRKCICDANYVLDNKNGSCVSVQSKCGRCAANSICNPCANGCVQSCKNIFVPEICNGRCQARCECKEGFVFNKDKVCVLESSCKPEVEVSCPKPNEIFSTCGSACPKTCSNMYLNEPCILMCVPGCQCRDDFVLNRANFCVRPIECEPDQIKCPSNQYLQDVYVNGIRRRKCVCNPGYRLDNSTNSCIRDNPCGRCAPNSICNPCGNGCVKSCKNLFIPEICNAKCQPRCECKEGFVFNKLKVCVLESTCKPEVEVSCTKPNEIFSTCGSACPKTCSNMYLNEPCVQMCVSGCQCRGGFVLNRANSCVQPVECEPNEIKCPSNQYLQDVYVNGIRRRKCVCNPGYRLDNSTNSCIRESPCGHCAANSVCNPCGNGCAKSCKNLFVPEICNARCQPRCECKEGFVFNKNKVCVLESSCKPEDEVSCPKPNSIFLTCGTACPKSCSNMYLNEPCVEMCVRGCQCRDGFVLNRTNFCVRPVECEPNEIKCPPNQNLQDVYLNGIRGRKCVCNPGYRLDNATSSCIRDNPCGRCPANSICNSCGNGCAKSCKNLFVPEICNGRCQPRCECKEGFVFNKDKACVLESSCKPEDEVSCPKPNSIFLTCGTACPKSCSNMYLNEPCVDMCVRGCQCRDGFVLNRTNFCVRPVACEPNEIKCPPNQHLQDVHLNGIRGRKCVCNPGYRLDNATSSCIRDSPCGRCPANSICNSCGNGCAKSCKNLFVPEICNGRCQPRCECKEGFVFNKDKVCVLESSCKPEHEVSCTKPNQIFSTCGSACPKTCSNMYLNEPCVKMCVSGCQCRGGFVLNRANSCVPPIECDPSEIKCPSNQHLQDVYVNGITRRNCICNPGYRLDNSTNSCIRDSPCGRCAANTICNTCGNGCVKSCKNLFVPKICNEKCQPRCECREGFAFNKDKVCVLESSCKPEDEVSCTKPNEIFSTCGTACPKTCSNMYLDEPCVYKCVLGCQCRENFVLNRANVCVRPLECQPNEIKCPPNQQLQDLYLNGVRNRKCVCIPGYRLDNSTNSCIRDSPCGRCAANSVCNPCGNGCAKSCKNLFVPEICNVRCQPRCECKEDFVFNKDKVCVLETSCKPEHEVSCTKPNEIFSTCGTACPKTCSNMYLDEPCVYKCVLGCQCREGFVLNRANICVRPLECEPNEIKCPPNQELQDVYLNGIRRRKCLCNPGYRLDNSTNSCIRDSPCGRCTANSICNPCGNGCTKSCKSLFVPETCNARCQPRCECKEGFVFNKDKVCVLESSCKPDDEVSCTKPNSVFLTCGSACPETCSNMYLNEPCVKMCVSGCQCRHGFVLNRANSCVPPMQCNPIEIKCPPNQQLQDIYVNGITRRKCVCSPGYRLDNSTNSCIRDSPCGRCAANSICNPCGNGCAKSCKSLFVPEICNARCQPRCECKEGFVFNKDKVCVLESSCKPEDEVSCTKPNSVFLTCGSACPETCSNMYLNEPCVKMCVSGCQCRHGFVLNRANYCVPPMQCNPIEIKCLPNQQLQDVYINGITRRKCVCNPGFRLDNSTNICIRESPCGPCPVNSICNHCGNGCAKSCKNLFVPEICNGKCQPRCECKEGFVFNKDKVCVLESSCKPEEEVSCTKPNSSFLTCGSACPQTCSNMYLNEPCVNMCVSGCQCRCGFVLNRANSCVPPIQCDPIEIKCPSNQHLQDVYVNGKTSRRCVCNPGFRLQNSTNICIKDSPCGRCAANSICNPCANGCAKSCKNLFVPEICNVRCQPRCECREGFVYNKDKVCVLESSCKPEVEVSCAKPNSIFSTCGSACPKTCSSMYLNEPCVKMCVSGCQCRSGFVLNRANVCVRPIECERIEIKCPSNQHLQDVYVNGIIRRNCVCNSGYRFDNSTKSCISNNPCGNCPRQSYCNPRSVGCPRTCQNLDSWLYCKIATGPRCECDDGLVFGKTGECEPIESCDLEIVTCPDPNAVYSTCGSSCPKSCSNMYLTTPCDRKCNLGCFCKQGFVLNSREICVKDTQCLPEEIICPDNQHFEEFYANGMRVRGCVCDTDHFIVNATSSCVPGNKCGKCPDNSFCNECSTRCRKTCENPFTTEECNNPCTPRCECNDGFVFNDQNVCVPIARCHKKVDSVCGENQELRCGTFCPKDCDNLHLMMKCVGGCRERCFCKEGYIFENSTSNKCVPVESCHTYCDADNQEVYYDKYLCGCVDGGLTDCPWCRPGCHCKEGYVRSLFGGCVEKFI